MADGIDLYAIFLEPLERLQADYFVTGSVASSAYGEPRFTQDLDLVLGLAAVQIPRFLALFPPEAFYSPPESSLREELDRADGGHFNLIHHATGIRADVYVVGTNRLHAWAMANRRRIELTATLSAWLAPPEYVVLRKLAWRAEGGGERHESDIRQVLAALGDAIDREFIDREAARESLTDLWNSLRS